MTKTYIIKDKAQKQVEITTEDTAINKKIKTPEKIQQEIDSLALMIEKYQEAKQNLETELTGVKSLLLGGI
jgi:predicted RNase H-like nuclease (RuvC/YqgF family)